jgi:2-polyprenyl-3-methyl-5-hydroxy-6-metoxy-1,4-benzoquinol methylase
MEEVHNSSAHKYGNYHKYYSFHPVQSRLSLIKPSLIMEIWLSQNKPSFFSILDIGCNEGDLSVEILRIAREVLPITVRCILLGLQLIL